MISAISKTGIPVPASAHTTNAGFAALLFMENGIGSDLGFVLAKGIVFSLLSNVTVLPCLIIIFSNFSDKDWHWPVIPTFRDISSGIVRFRWLFLVIVVLVAAPSFLAQNNLKYYYSIERYLPENSHAVMDTNRIRDIFMSTEAVYVITPDEGNVKEKELAGRIEAVDAVDSVLGLSQQVDLTIPETYIPADVKDRYIKDGYRFFEVRLSTPSDDPRTF